jgi:uncharacterized protein (TIGR04255 family)
VLAIGDRSVQFGSKGGYPGWEGFNDSVLQVLESLRQTGFAGNVERFSLKAINLFDGEAGAQLDVLNAKAELAGRRVPEFGFRMRAEFSEGADVGIVDIATNATLTMPAGDQRTGLLLDVDCVRTRGDSDFWASAAREVDELHHFQKKLFFSLLTDQTLSGLGPVYEDT